MNCPTTALVHLIGDRWSLSIIHLLQSGPARHQALVRSLPGISTRTLSDRLKELEQLGLVSREVYAEVPPRVEYSLTLQGQMLEPVFVAIGRVGPRIVSFKRVSTARREMDSAVCPTCARKRPSQPRSGKARRMEKPVPVPPAPVRPILAPRAPFDDITLL